MFHFPATAAILLRTHTWMGETAIANWLRNYGRGGHSEGQPFWVMSTHGHHYRVRAVGGGFFISATRNLGS